jgi:hypothetical protein
METNPYQDAGYEDREEYLKHLSQIYEVDETSVISLAELLGPEEDFDGLIEDLKDFSSFIL